MTGPVARIVVRGHVADVYAPFELREVIKSFPGRKWRPAAKAWEVPRHVIADLADALEDCGCTVFVSGDAEPSSASKATAGWAEMLLDAVGDDLAPKVYRALVCVLHPDHGGHHQLMVELNRARDRRTARP